MNINIVSWVKGTVNRIILMILDRLEKASMQPLLYCTR